MTPPNVAIIGFGIEAVAAANYFSDSKILIYDDRDKNEISKDLFTKLKVKANFYFKKAINQKIDIVIRSPGVRKNHPQIQKLTKNGAKLSSSTKIFFEKCPAKIIGVTGTKGKGTTSTLIYEMLKTENKDVFLAGNIGTPMLEILPKVRARSLVILELSSFQLIDLERSPHIAVVLMITSEHLDWHTSAGEYQQAKLAIVKYQKPDDFAIINQDFEKSRDFQNHTKGKVYFFSSKRAASGAFIEDDYLVSRIGGYEKICKIDMILLPGSHNLQNAAAAVSVAKILGIDNQNIAGVLATFKGLIHRLQLVRVVGRVSYYNDSFSTTPETTIAAIETFENPKILIVGGSSKKSDFGSLGQKIKSDYLVKAVILIGDEAPRIKEAITGFRGQILEGAKNMQAIVSIASSIAQSGDVVLFSPACASFDMFKNYKDRGEQFIKEVRSLRP